MLNYQRVLSVFLVEKMEQQDVFAASIEGARAWAKHPGDATCRWDAAKFGKESVQG